VADAEAGTRGSADVLLLNCWRRRSKREVLVLSAAAATTTTTTEGVYPFVVGDKK
jgi:hypothetical protein